MVILQRRENECEKDNVYELCIIIIAVKCIKQINNFDKYCVWLLIFEIKSIVSFQIQTDIYDIQIMVRTTK